jgi:hypothetical protein
MDESFSPTIFLYGIALVVAVGKAFTLTIWRTLPKPKPGLRQEMLQAWKNRRLRKQTATSPVRHSQSEQTVDDPLRDAGGAEAESHTTVPTPEQGLATLSGSNPAPEK